MAMQWLQLKIENVNFVWHTNITLEQLQFMFWNENLNFFFGNFVFLEISFSLYLLHFNYQKYFHNYYVILCFGLFYNLWCISNHKWINKVPSLTTLLSSWNVSNAYYNVSYILCLEDTCLLVWNWLADFICLQGFTFTEYNKTNLNVHLHVSTGSA